MNWIMAGGCGIAAAVWARRARPADKIAGKVMGLLLILSPLLMLWKTKDTAAALSFLGLTWVLTEAARSDLASREVSDVRWMEVLALSLTTLEAVGLGARLLGAAGLTLLTFALSRRGERFGGADIKMCGVMGWYLGPWAGSLSVSAGLALFLLTMRVFHKNQIREPQPLVPYLALSFWVGALLV